MTRSLSKTKYFDDIIDGSSIQIHFNSLKWIPIRIPYILRCFLLALSDFLHDQHPPVHFLGNFEIGQVYCLCITVLCEVVFYISKRDLNSALNKFLLFPLYLCDANVFPLKGMFFGVPFSLYDFFCPDGNFFIFTSLFELKENSSLFFQRVAMSHWDVFCKCLGKLLIFSQDGFKSLGTFEIIKMFKIQNLILLVIIYYSTNFRSLSNSLHF